MDRRMNGFGAPDLGMPRKVRIISGSAQILEAFRSGSIQCADLCMFSRIITGDGAGQYFVVL
jgi:hypothetical protein